MIKITLACIYNSVNEYKRMIVSLIKAERMLDLRDIEFMGIYNRNNLRFSSAREAISWIMKRSKGKYILFVHQDVEFLSDDPMYKLLKFFRSLQDVGIIGVAGINHENRLRGFIINGNVIWGEPFFIPKGVDGVDELFFALERKKFSDFTFLNIREWHGYATELCMYSKRKKWNNYVVPITVIHKSFGKNRKKLLRVHRKLEKVYKDILPFATTVGVLGAKRCLLLLEPKFVVKNFLNKISLRFSSIYVKTKASFLYVCFALCPVTRKLYSFIKNDFYVLNFLVSKDSRNVFFVHVRDSVDGKRRFNDILVESRSLSNYKLVPREGKVIHLYISIDKIKDISNYKVFKDADQIIIENYKFISNAEEKLSKLLNSGNYKTTIRISNFISFISTPR